MFSEVFSIAFFSCVTGMLIGWAVVFFAAKEYKTMFLCIGSAFLGCLLVTMKFFALFAG